jgi:hypothetical protein
MALLAACTGGGGPAGQATFTISGTIAGGPNVVVNLYGDGGSASVHTDQYGDYLFGSLAPGRYTVTPSVAGFTFSPAQLDVTVSVSDVTDQNFVFSLSGEPACTADGWCSWNIQPQGKTPGSVLGQQVLAVWGSATNDVWAVGSLGSIMHWDGSAWRSFPSGVRGYLFAVWGSGANDVWAVGGNDILHWNGSAWSNVEYPVHLGAVGALHAIWGSGANDVWVVAEDGALHWDGGTWSQVDIPAVHGEDDGLGFNGNIWGSGANDVWVVGNWGTILHWDGAAWSSVTNPATGATVFLRAIWGNEADDVWVVGEVDQLDPSGTFPVFESGTILHWDGTAWASAESGTTFELGSIWGSSASDVWSVGFDAATPNGLIRHWDGSAWSTTMSPTMTVPFFGPVWGIGTSDVWLVGQSDVILRRHL